MSEVLPTPLPRPRMLIAFVAGALFAAGLAASGMTQPSKVLGFLDLAGDWDPSLAFVMVGAIAVYATASRYALRLRRPLVGGGFHLPTRRDLDARLLLGAAIFGVGWGLAGYCPGPALTALGAASLEALVFVVCMVGGMYAAHATRARR